MQSKLPWDFILPQPDCLRLRKQITTNPRVAVAKGDPLFSVGGSEMDIATVESSVKGPQKARNK